MNETFLDFETSTFVGSGETSMKSHFDVLHRAEEKHEDLECKGQD
jgi:hypothetical protein